MVELPLPFRLTSHARKRMAERSISEALINDSLKNPTKIEQDEQQRILIKKIYEKRGKKRLLLLALEREHIGLCVVTVIDTTKIKKYL